MKRASFIQSLSLILGGMATTAGLPFEDGPNHVIIGSNIKTIDTILSESIKDKRHLKMFQHMIPSWVKSNKIDISNRFQLMSPSIREFGNDINSAELRMAAGALFISWGTHDGYMVSNLLEYYNWHINDARYKKDYENRLNKLYNLFKETQTA